MPTYSNTGSRVHVVGNPPRTFKPGETGFETPLIIDHLEGVTRTSDAPRFNLWRNRHDLSFDGAGRQAVTLTDPHLIKAIQISASMDVDMFLGDITNTPGKRLLANHDYYLMPGGTVEVLVFDSPAAGSVVVEVVAPTCNNGSNDGDEVTFGGEGVTLGGQGLLW